MIRERYENRMFLLVLVKTIGAAYKRTHLIVLTVSELESMTVVVRTAENSHLDLKQELERHTGNSFSLLKSQSPLPSDNLTARSHLITLPFPNKSINWGPRMQTH